MRKELDRAIENGEFSLYYQPQFSLTNGLLKGMEALVRWVDPIKGIITPDRFIPFAERSGQIYALELWIFKRALQQKMEWEKSGLTNLKISINLSAKTLSNPIYFNQIDEIISSFNINYSNVFVEITETAIISNMSMAIDRLNTLREKGLKIALDDFGTGYSSLKYLKEFPIDAIKLDKSFIKSIGIDSVDSIIVKYLLFMARDLNYQVIAEGIETKTQLDYLRKHFCQLGQGYLLGMPIPKDEADILLEKKTCAAL